MERYLEPGEKLELKGIDGQYVIKKILGRGSSCVVYTAEFYNSKGEKTEHLLKEFNPKCIELKRENGILSVVREEDAELFNKLLERFKDGFNRQSQLREVPELKNYTANIQNTYYDHGTVYIDMTVTNGQSYANPEFEETSLLNLAKRIKVLSQVIGAYHKQGYLHLDIKPSNIFVRPVTETCEDVLLFDFDSFVPFTEVDGKCVIDKAVSVSYTCDYAPIEVLSASRRSKICRASDIYEIGEVFFEKLMGRHSTALEHNILSEYAFDFTSPLFENVNCKVRPLLTELFRHTLCNNVAGRYQTTEELIAKLDEIIAIADPKAPYLKDSMPNVSGFFTGRDSEIEEIHKRLQENNVLFLSGIGGIGKSELAKHYAEVHKDSYDAIIFAPFVNDIQTMITSDNYVPIHNVFQYPEEKPNEYFERKMRELAKLCDERTLLIVDNFDTTEDENLSRLLSLDCKILITTRRDFTESYPDFQLDLGTLLNPIDVFNEHYKKPLSDEERKCVDEIIEIVCGHTMTVELLAKQMMAGRVKPDKMLEKLKDGGIGESGKEKVFHANEKGEISRENTYDHIQALFDLSELSEDKKYILANLSLIPYTGISTELFHDWCELEDYECINSLVAEGWIHLDKDKDYISLHPVISEITVSIIMHHPFWTNAIYKNLTYLCDHQAFGKLSVSDRIPQLELFANFADQAVRIQIRTTDVAKYLSSDFWNEHAVGSLRNSYVRVKQYYQTAIDIWSYCCHTSCTELVEATGNLGLVSAYSGDNQSAEDITYNAIAIIKQISDFDISLMAALYVNLGYILAEKGDYKKSEEYHKKAIEVYTKISPVPNEKVAMVHNNLASLYQDYDNFDAAEDHFKIGLNILLKINGELHEDTALLYNNLGCLYTEIDKISMAKEFYLKALEIRRKLFGEQDANTADSYHGLGFIQLRLKEYENAEDNLTKALEIRKSVFGPVSPKVANSHNVLGGLFDEQWRQSDAEKHYLSALNIRSCLFGEENPDVALSYSNLGAFYFEIGQYGQAEKYIKTALSIRRKVLGDNHSDTAVSYFHLGRLLRQKDELGEARAYMEKGYKICKKIFGDNHPKSIIMKEELSKF